MSVHSENISAKLLRRYLGKGRKILRKEVLRGLHMELVGLLYFRSRTQLWADISHALRVSPSTGCNFAELHALHSQILQIRPYNVLELGSGISTIVLADAAMRLRLRNRSCFVTSMEESPEYAAATQRIIPGRLSPVVEVICSPVVRLGFEDGWIGLEYDKRPEKEWDFIFIDGPQLPDNSRESKFFDSDLLSILKLNSTPLVAYLDGRASTQRRLSQEKTLAVKRGKFLTRFEFVSP